MNIQQAMFSICDIGFGGIVGYALGYAYGAVFNVNNKVAAQAVMMHCIAMATLKNFALFATGGSIFVAAAITPKNPTGRVYDNPQAYRLLNLAGEPLIEIVSIIAFRRLNLIGNLGTALITLNVIMGILELKGAIAAYNPNGSQG